MRIVFQLQNTNYFCSVNKILNTLNVVYSLNTYFNYLYFNYYTTLAFYNGGPAEQPHLLATI